MPLYEYHCDGCDNRFEILQRIGEGPEGLSCPECGEEQLGKLFSTFASAGTDKSTPSMAPAGGCCQGTST